MKLTVGLILLFTLLEATAAELKVDKMTNKQGMERSFDLHTKSTTESVGLDCQSFIQGLTIGLEEEALLFMLDPQECEELYLRVKGSLKKRQKHCIDVEDEIRDDYTCT